MIHQNTSTDGAPAPYPLNTRLLGRHVAIDHDWLINTDEWILSPHGSRPWLLMLHVVAWLQTPCGSLPGDHEALAAHLGMTVGQLEMHSPFILRGWRLHIDGRLYHEAVTRQVIELIDSRRSRSYRKHWDQVIAAHGEACVYCGAEHDLSLDHVIPQSRGGGHDPSNLVPACRSCNSSKSDKTPSEWGRL